MKHDSDAKLKKKKKIKHNSDTMLEKTWHSFETNIKCMRKYGEETEIA